MSKRLSPNQAVAIIAESLAARSIHGGVTALLELRTRKADTRLVNEWSGITPEDFGFSFDVIVERHVDMTILDPTSQAALQWLYRHLPADCPRWGKLGFVIENDQVSRILNHMADDGLKTEAEYTRAMNEEQELQNAQAHAADQENCHE
jgi:hypothetical protein